MGRTKIARKKNLASVKGGEAKRPAQSQPSLTISVNVIVNIIAVILNPHSRNQKKKKNAVIGKIIAYTKKRRADVDIKSRYIGFPLVNYFRY